ncbi:MAG: hypothetical protein HOQ09_02295 [Gemmatimonadaceae bacterium]|nr:hypothetical protein [Gemmatimonadaceae bacterium]
MSRRRSVRPDGLALLLALAAIACGHREKAVSDTATAGSRAPSPYVSEIPAWPADTSDFATDRTGRFPAALRAKVPSCGAATPVVARDSIGPLYPGQPLPIVLGVCRNALRLWHWDDGSYLPAIAVKLGDALVVADMAGMTADDVVSRVIAIEGARTAEGIGPGSSLAELQRAYGAPTWRRNQCTVDAAFESRPGLVARIAVAPSTGAASCADVRRYGDGNDFSRFPPGSRVEWIAAELGAAG